MKHFSKAIASSLAGPVLANTNKVIPLDATWLCSQASHCEYTYRNTKCNSHTLDSSITPSQSCLTPRGHHTTNFIRLTIDFWVVKPPSFSSSSVWRVWGLRILFSHASLKINISCKSIIRLA